MNTELSFLLDILLEHKLPKKVKELVTARIKEVEAGLNRTQLPVFIPPPKTFTITGPPQAPSTLANFEKHGEPLIYTPPPDTHPSVQQVAQTSAAAQALQTRQDAIRGIGKDLYKPRPKAAPK